MSVILVTGEIDSGKTRWMRERADLPGRVGWLSVKVFDGTAGGRPGYDLLTLPGGARIPLAREGAESGGDGWFPFRRFFFNPDAFSAAESSFEELHAQRPREFLLDEAGPLECEGGGFAPLIERLLDTGIDLALSVRPSLLDELPSRFGFAPNEIVRL